MGFNEFSKHVTLPAGTPEWITPELVISTQRIWQRHYESPVSVEIAITILESTGRLCDLLSGGLPHETLRRTGSGEQP